MKKMLALLLAVGMVVTLGACGKKPEPEPDPAPSNVIEGLPGLDGGDQSRPQSGTDGGQGGSDAVPDASGGDGTSDPAGQEDRESAVGDVGPEDPGQEAGGLEEGAEYFAVIEVEDYGTVRAVLYPDKAPVTVANFVKLADAGFYDGLTFHRIMKDFMIQGGDPLGNGTGGAQETIYGEFADNGWRDNDIPHERGALSMARASSPDSASSQFFIMHADAKYLDGKYAAFGRVVEGMEHVDAICDAVTPIDDNGTVISAEQPVIASVRIEVVRPEADAGAAGD